MYLPYQHGFLTLNISCGGGDGGGVGWGCRAAGCCFAGAAGMT